MAQQVACGIDVVNDGEMSKPSYTMYVRHRVTGIKMDPRAAEKGRDIMLGRDSIDHPDLASVGDEVRQHSVSRLRRADSPTPTARRSNATSPTSGRGRQDQSPPKPS